MKVEIESITRVLDQNQISLFKEKHCEYCRHYGGDIIPFCSAEVEDNVSVSKIIIYCIENDLFSVKMEIVRSE